MSEGLNTPAVNESTALSDSYTKAVELNNRIIVSGQMAQRHLMELCRSLKEMKDLGLYSELGYSSFDEYTEQEVGIKTRQAYRYISIAENLTEEFLSSSAKIGVSKLYLLSSLSKDEREEIVKDTDIENVTSRELEGKIKELREDLQRTRERNLEFKGRITELEEEGRKNEKQYEQLAFEADTTSKKNKELEAKIQELESRPVEITANDNSEMVEELKGSIDSMKIERKLLEEKHRAELKAVEDGYKEKLSRVQKQQPQVAERPSADPKEAFKLYYTAAYNAFSSLVEFTKKQDEEHKKIFAERIEKLADSMRASVEL